MRLQIGGSTTRDGAPGARRWRARIAGAVAFALVASVGLAVLPSSGPAEATGSKDLYPSVAGDNACGMAGATQNASALTNHDTSVTYSKTNGPNQSCRYLLE